MKPDDKTERIKPVEDREEHPSIEQEPESEAYSCTASCSRRNRSGGASFADTWPTSRPPLPTISEESLSSLDTLHA